MSIGLDRRKATHWRCLARLLAALANAAMVLYVFIAFLLCEVSWSHFGNRGNPRRLTDHIWRGDLDLAFEYLRLFSFSEAMLANLKVYTMVGAVVAIVFFLLERRRIRWLQALISRCMSHEEAKRAGVWLEVYLWTVSFAICSVVMLAYFHLGKPHAHYLFAGLAFSSGCCSVCIYLFAPINVSELATKAAEVYTGHCNKSIDFMHWALRVQRWTWPVLRIAVLLHIVALALGMWKVQHLEDDYAALAFGVAETAVVLGYQLFLGVFVVDDVMVEGSAFHILQKTD